VEFELLKRLQGYTRQDLLDEDAQFIDDCLVYIRAEGHAASERARKA
jgi:hypothetical protein